MDPAILDDEAALRAGDPSGLLDAFLGIAEQLEPAYGASRGTPGLAGPWSSVTFCGMGGSAAAADAAVAILRPAAEVPLGIVRGHGLPAHCRGGSLVVCLSYSGGTEEAVACAREAVSRECAVVAICAGGALAEVPGVTLVRVPPDAGMPRAALGYLTGAVIGVVGAAGVDLPDEDQLREAVATLRATAAELAPGARDSEAKRIAAWLGDRLPVIWGSEGITEPAALRWKAAFNENAKIPAVAAALPELDHHEVVGWTKPWGEGFGLLVLRADDEHPSLEARLAATLEVVGDSGLEHREVRARGRSKLAQALSLMLLGDVASTYHALARGVDPAPIEAIARIKARTR